MFGLRLPELIIILVIALVIFGPGKLPDVGASLGKSIKEFKKASNELTKDINGSEATDEKKTDEKK